MKAIVDCNSFYCSCERLFKPVFEEKPVVVLSNNDGCVIARTDEAKALGIDMTGPYFMVKDTIAQHRVGVFSSNYNLYGDMSWRVMKTLREMVGEQNVEVYSVDEAFLDLSLFDKGDYSSIAMDLRKTVEKWTGIKVSVGVAPTKTLSKLANKLAKKDKKQSQCVAVLDTHEKIMTALKATAVEDLWGIGNRFAQKLTSLGICTGWDLYNISEEWARTNLGGVVGVRMIRELRGEESLLLQDPLQTKKMIATTRMFGRTLSDLKEIKEAVATYASRAAVKLRRQHSAATVLNVFLMERAEKRPVPYRPGYTVTRHTILPTPTVLTHELIKPALQLTEAIFQQGRRYCKAGVILSGLVPDTSIQANLFDRPSRGGERFLMDMLDNINFSMRGDMVKFASSGMQRGWKMRQEFHSPRYTTRWEELCEVM